MLGLTPGPVRSNDRLEAWWPLPGDHSPDGALAHPGLTAGYTFSFLERVGAGGVRRPRHALKRAHLSRAPQKQTTLNNGYLGSHNDEERSEMRYLM